MDNEYRLSARQILTRIISVIVAGVGGSACGFSLLMQVQEIGTIIASITWFSGLLAVVFALSGYAVSCDPGKGKSYIPLAVGAVLVITGSALARIYLYAHMVIVIALIAAAVEGVVLIIYHFILKREDPEAL